MIGAVLALLLAQTAEETPARAVIDFSAGSEESGWISVAFEENAARDLSGHRVEIVDKRTIDTKDCWGRKTECLLDAYARAGVDIIILGNLAGRTLEFEVYEGWLRTRVASDSIDLDGRTNPLAVRHATLRAVSPFFESGGLLEKKRFMVRRAQEGALDWIFPMLGGALWGWFLLVVLRLALPAIPGLGNIRHGNVGPMLRAWSIASLLRALLLFLFYAPFALLFWNASRTAWMIAAPAAGLLLHLLLMISVARLARRIDRSLVSGEATPSNRWHPIVKKYFTGYVRRLGLELDRALLERVLFLPGKSGGIVAYGGGLGPPRIVVNESLLETALHPAADEPQFDEEEDRSLDAGDPRGILLPGGAYAAPPEATEQRPVSRRMRVRPLLGQNETLLGTILPLPAGESVPLVIDDPDEYSVLRELLTAHYAAFDPGLYGEEADDTDPTQKDFLFGALLRELGAIQRQDALLFTITISLDLALTRAPDWMRAVQRGIALFYRRFLSRYPAIVADGYSALNRGLDHLIQHLFYLRSASTALTTARADEPTLAATSAEILRRVAAEEADPEDQLRNRLVWLSQHLHAPVAEPRKRAVELIAALAILFLLGGALTAAIVESIDYGPIYEKRIREQKQKIEEAREKGASPDVRRY